MENETVKFPNEEYLEEGAVSTEWKMIAWRLATELKIARSLLILNPNVARDIFISEVDNVLKRFEEIREGKI